MRGRREKLSDVSAASLGTQYYGARILEFPLQPSIWHCALCSQQLLGTKSPRTHSQNQKLPFTDMPNGATSVGWSSLVPGYLLHSSHLTKHA